MGGGKVWRKRDRRKYLKRGDCSFPPRAPGSAPRVFPNCTVALSRGWVGAGEHLIRKLQRKEPGSQTRTHLPKPQFAYLKQESVDGSVTLSLLQSVISGHTNDCDHQPFWSSPDEVTDRQEAHCPR